MERYDCRLFYYLPGNFHYQKSKLFPLSARAQSILASTTFLLPPGYKVLLLLELVD